MAELYGASCLCSNDEAAKAPSLSSPGQMHSKLEARKSPCLAYVMLDAADPYSSGHCGIMLDMCMNGNDHVDLHQCDWI